MDQVKKFDLVSQLELTGSSELFQALKTCNFWIALLAFMDVILYIIAGSVQGTQAIFDNGIPEVLWENLNTILVQKYHATVCVTSSIMKGGRRLQINQFVRFPESKIVVCQLIKSVDILTRRGKDNGGSRESVDLKSSAAVLNSPSDANVCRSG